MDCHICGKGGWEKVQRLDSHIKVAHKGMFGGKKKRSLAVKGSLAIK